MRHNSHGSGEVELRAEREVEYPQEYCGQEYNHNSRAQDCFRIGYRRRVFELRGQCLLLSLGGCLLKLGRVLVLALEEAWPSAAMRKESHDAERDQAQQHHRQKPVRAAGDRFEGRSGVKECAEYPADCMNRFWRFRGLGG